MVLQGVVVLKERPLRGSPKPTLQRERPVATQLVHSAAARFALQTAGAKGVHVREQLRIVVRPREPGNPPRGARIGLPWGTSTLRTALGRGHKGACLQMSNALPQI